jgi:hypothetical protein
MQYKLFADARRDEIPRQQGVYAFFLDLVSPGKIGLAGRGPWSEETLALAKEALLRRLRLQLQVFSSVELTGSLEQADKYGPVRAVYAMTAAKLQTSEVAEGVERLPIDAIRDYAQLVHETSAFAQPIYVGIAYDQTLSERYEQHRGSHRGEGDAGFGARLRTLGIEWDDVVFACSPFVGQSGNGPLLRQVERTLHAAAHPILSIR